MLIDRGRRADRYPWLEWKVRLFLLGACMAIAGMLLEMQWIVAVALAILVLAFLVRFMPGGKGEDAEPGPEPDTTGWP
jgi:hypothetical protein